MQDDTEHFEKVAQVCKILDRRGQLTKKNLDIEVFHLVLQTYCAKT